MKTSDNEFQAKVAELERVFHRDSPSSMSYSRPVYRSAYSTDYKYKPGVKRASIVCGLMAGSLLFTCSYGVAIMEVIKNPSAAYASVFGQSSPAYSSYYGGPDPHTIEGTAAIHESMQSGTVNVAKSTITGIVDSESQTASLYWTFVLKNNNSTDKEAAITIDLPKNSALSRATLWINGVAQEASFSSNSQVQSAYDSIVVRHRDPLLVTQIGPNQIKILAAPVKANGGEMQFRIGITAPAERDENGRNIVRMPSIVKSNLKFDGKQDIHLNSDTVIGGIGETERSGIYTLRANLAADELNKVKVTLKGPSSKSFATRLTHTSPAEYVEADLVDGQLELKRLKEKPSCKIVPDDDVAFRLSNLWAHQQIERLAAHGDLNAACDVANVYRIVSSVSGATVLEEENDYSNNGLNREMYRTLGKSASTGDDFTTVHGFVPYSAGAAVIQGGAPMLQGATNGTIGPQSDDAFAIQGLNSAGTVRVNNLANLEALLNVLTNLFEIVAITVTCFLLSEAAINDGLHVPVRLSRSKVIILALGVLALGLSTPSFVNMLITFMRDTNMFS